MGKKQEQPEAEKPKCSRLTAMMGHGQDHSKPKNPPRDNTNRGHGRG